MKRRVERRKEKVKRTKRADGGGAAIGRFPEKDILSTRLVRKATTHKGRKILELREPQVNELPKQSVFLRGSSCGLSPKQLLTELHMLRKPFSLNLTRKQQGLDPFTNFEPLEYLAGKNDCGLFCYGSSSKRRPFRFVMGRVFEKMLLDLYEVHLSDYKPLKLFGKVRQPVMGSKPLVIAQGSEFDSSELAKNFRNYLLDFFSIGKPSKLLVQGIDQLITLTSLPPLPPTGGTTAPETCPGIRAVFRRYRIDQQKTTGTTPDISLEECGPRFTMALDRNRLADRDVWKTAIKLPKEVKAAKIKNVLTNVLGEKLGRVHVGAQDLNKLYTPHHHSMKDSLPEREERDAAM